MKTRNYSIDFLRIILMAGICYLHAAGGYADIPMSAWLAKLLFPCVPCFVFISGYYGVTFNPIKLLRLWLLAYFCAFISECLLATINGVDFNVHFFSWVERISSSMFLRYWRICGVLVLTFMPFEAGSAQAACRERAPESTTHMRQAPISLISFK